MLDNLITIDNNHQGICTVTLNKPKSHNAMDDDLIAVLTKTWQQIADDDSVRAVILAANGKSFCAGADLYWMKRSIDYTEQENIKDTMGLAKMLNGLNTLNKPTIAQVQGVAFGGGAGLLACCDIVIASENASFSFSEVKLGLIPATISPYVIAQIGMKAARRYFLTAERFNAHEALRIGLVDEVTPFSELVVQTQAIAQLICANGPQAVAASKQLIHDVHGKTIDSGLMKDTAQRIANVRASEEGQEGLAAFFDKRNPAWKNDHV